MSILTEGMYVQSRCLNEIGGRLGHNAVQAGDGEIAQELSKIEILVKWIPLIALSTCLLTIAIGILIFHFTPGPNEINSVYPALKVVTSGLIGGAMSIGIILALT